MTKILRSDTSPPQRTFHTECVTYMASIKSCRGKVTPRWRQSWWYVVPLFSISTLSLPNANQREGNDAECHARTRGLAVVSRNVFEARHLLRPISRRAADVDINCKQRLVEAKPNTEYKYLDTHIVPYTSDSKIRVEGSFTAGMVDELPR